MLIKRTGRPDQALLADRELQQLFSWALNQSSASSVHSPASLTRSTEWILISPTTKFHLKPFPFSHKAYFDEDVRRASSLAELKICHVGALGQ